MQVTKGKSTDPWQRQQRHPSFIKGRPSTGGRVRLTGGQKSCLRLLLWSPRLQSNLSMKSFLAMVLEMNEGCLLRMWIHRNSSSFTGSASVVALPQRPQEKAKVDVLKYTRIGNTPGTKLMEDSAVGRIKILAELGAKSIFDNTKYWSLLEGTLVNCLIGIMLVEVYRIIKLWMRDNLVAQREKDALQNFMLFKTKNTDRHAL